MVSTNSMTMTSTVATGEQRPLVEESETKGLTDEPIARVRRSRCQYLIEPIFFISALSGFTRILLDPLLILRLTAEEMAGNGTSLNISELVSRDGCDVNMSDPIVQFRGEVQEKSANFIIYQYLANFFPSIVACLFLGPYSDRAGRKYALIPPDLTCAACSAIYACVIYLDWSRFYLLIGNFIEGVGGRYQMALLGTFSYIADITNQDQRTFRIVVIEMLMFASGVAGFIGVGVWTETVGFLQPYLFVVGGKVVTTLAYAFMLPETVRKDPAVTFLTTEHLKSMYKTFRNKVKPTRNTDLALLMVSFSFPIVLSLSTAIDTLFLSNTPLCWTSSRIGYYSAAYIGAVAVGGIVGSKLMKRCLADHWIAMVAAVSLLVSTVYKAFVMTSVMMYIVPFLTSLGGMYIPTVRALMSNSVESDEQGCVFGAVACSEVVGNLIGSMLINTVYAETVTFMSGFVYLFGGCLYLIGMVSLLFYIKRKKKRYHGPLPPEDTE